MTKRFMVIPDIHGRDKWKAPCLAFLENEPEGTIVMLGDYLDSFDVQDKPMMDNFKDIINLCKEHPERIVLLLGNHCFPYISRYYSCSGNRNSIWNQANQLYTGNLAIFQMAYQYKDTLFVHAGLSEGWLESNKYELGLHLGDIGRYLLEGGEGKYADILNAAFVNPQTRQLFWQISSRSGGLDPHDSPIWVRPMELVKDTIPGLHQVIGHTGVQHTSKVAGFGKDSFITMTDCMGNPNWEPLILNL